MPFEQVVSALKLPRDPGHNPLFSVNFRAQAQAAALPELAGLDTSFVWVDIGYSRFDLALELQSGPDELLGYFEYDLDLFDPESIDRFVDAWGDVLRQVLSDPDVPILAIALPPIARRHQRRAGRPVPTRARRGAD
jgi:non-ribosomal peptide synthetase component F